MSLLQWCADHFGQNQRLALPMDTVQSPGGAIKWTAVIGQFAEKKQTT
jgi:hypothetical protein